MSQTFSAQVGEWVRKVEAAFDAVFRQSVSELVEEIQAGAPIDTGFLKSSLVAAKDAMPVLSRQNPGGSFPVDGSQIEAVIQGTDAGEVIFLGYTANYGAYVHYGAGGRAPRPWVTLAAQKWPQIVERNAAKAKAQFGL